MSSNLPDFPKRLPEKLRAIRKRCGLTPEQFAPVVGLSNGTEIVACENNHHDLLVSVLWRYCKLAGVSIEKLIDDNRDL